jgi:hypothetical protein
MRGFPDPAPISTDGLQADEICGRASWLGQETGHSNVFDGQDCPSYKLLALHFLLERGQLRWRQLPNRLLVFANFLAR